MLPSTERAAYEMTVYEAGDLAGAGEALNGYRCLLGGMERATELLECGEPWADELVALYREALDRYGEAHGVRLDAERSSREKWPRTVPEAVERLLDTLTDEEREQVGQTAEADLIILHFGLGTYIRNEFGLWGDNEALRQSIKGDRWFMHEDDMSTVVIEALWRALRSTDAG